MPATNDLEATADRSAMEAEEHSESDQEAITSPEAEAPPDPARIPTWKIVVVVGAGIASLLFLYGAFSIIGREEAPPLALAGDPNAVVDAEPAVASADSLGLRFTEVRERWNSLDRPPQITTELRRSPEVGDLDSFFHRFDSSAELLGAYQDDGDFVVALLARSHMASGGAQYMYLHLCHTLHPFSPECIDNYFENGLDGRTLEEAAESDMVASWDFAGNDWGVEITNDVLTIRVQSPSG